MRWPVVRLVWSRELRDLLRDRRTLLMLLGIPVMLYPLFGIVGFAFALTMLKQETRLGLIGGEQLPPLRADNAFVGPGQHLGWVGLLPMSGLADPLARTCGQLARQQHASPPPLVANGRFLEVYLSNDRDVFTHKIVPLEAGELDAALASKRVDAVMVVSAGFADTVVNGRAVIEVKGRDGDELSKLAVKRATQILTTYGDALKMARFQRVGLTLNFDRPLEVRDAQDGQPLLQRTSDELRDMLVRFFPFMLVMWSMAGSLYPAIDLCAGEKERGTMETLLISPARRSEIVLGKFGAVWAFSAGTALWNLLWLGGGTLLGGRLLGVRITDPAGLAWCVVFAVPQAALFSACCLGLGAYARSSKEGQYYLLPMFLATMPLVLLSMTPGAELSPGNCWLPITGTCLLLQRMLAGDTSWATWAYFPPVFGGLAVAVTLALRWAISQFHREDVLFRESERLDLVARVRQWWTLPRAAGSR